MAEKKKKPNSTLKKDTKKIKTKETKVSPDVSISDSRGFNTRYFVYAAYFIIIIVAVVVAQYFLNKKIADNVLASISYFEKSSVDYRVYYRDNDFFSQPYIEKDKTYISSLIKNIDVEMDYYVNYSSSLKGKYNYYIEATIYALDPADESKIYWEKSYELTEKQEIEFKDKNDYRIHENVKVDYQKYNKLLSEFKSQLMLSTDSFVRVQLVIENEGVYPGVEPFKYTSDVSLDIPLSETAIEMSIKSNLADKEHTFKTTEDNQAVRVYSKIVGGLCWLLAIFLSACFALTYHNDLKKESLYMRKLKKILTTYDSIIVNIEKMPSLSEMNVVKVTNFEELVDAQGEVRLPINYKEDKLKREAKFILVRNNLAWVYILKEDDLREEK